MRKGLYLKRLQSAKPENSRRVFRSSNSSSLRYSSLVTEIQYSSPQEHKKVPTAIDTVQSPKKLNISLYSRKRLNCFEAELDSKEIKLENFHIIDPNSPEEEFEIYKDYMQKIAVYIKNKNEQIGECLIRGLNGLSKSFNNCLSAENISKIVYKPASLKSNQETQTETEEEEILLFEYDESPELENFKDLLKKIKRFESGRITSYLRQIYRSLRGMYTEVPDLSEVSEDFLEGFEKVNQQLKQMLRSGAINNELLKEEIFIKVDGESKVEISKSDEQEDSSKYFINLLTEKDMENLKLKREMKHIQLENNRLSEKLKNSYATELEGKISKLEISLAEKEKKLVEQIKLTEENKKLYEKLKSSFGKMRKMIEGYEKICQELNSRNNEKIELADTIEASVHQLKSEKKILGIKLYEIQKAMEQKSTEEFVFANPNEESVKASIPLEDFKEKFKKEFSGNYLKELKRKYLGDTSFLKKLDHAVKKMTHKYEVSDKFVDSSSSDSDSSERTEEKISRKPSTATEFLSPNEKHPESRIGRTAKNTIIKIDEEGNPVEFPVENHKKKKHRRKNSSDSESLEKREEKKKKERIRRIKGNYFSDSDSEEEISYIKKKQNKESKYENEKFPGTELLLEVLDEETKQKSLEHPEKFDFSIYELRNLDTENEVLLKNRSDNLKELINLWEEALLSKLDKKHTTLYKNIKKGENLRDILIKQLQIINFSSGVQYDSRYPNKVYSEKPVFKPEFRQSRISDRSQTIANSLRQSIFQKKEIDFNDLDEEQLECLRNLPGLSSIFTKEEIMMMPAHLRLQLYKAMQGHSSGCREGECEHLKRAMALKMKCRLKPYPIKRGSIIGMDY